MDYSLKDIARISGVAFVGRNNRADSIMTDSRHSFGGHEHPLFVAVEGLNHDGHDFIAELYGRGVRAFMIEKTIDVSKFPEAGFARVESSIRALQMLAADYRGQFRGLMVGITGSSGKTTVKEWIARLAPEGMKIFRSPRSYNSQLGVPLSMLMMRGDEEVALIEAGISRPGEMERLARIIRPDVGIFTGIGPEHSENFESDEDKIREKAKLFATCKKVICDDSPRVKDILTENAPNADFIDTSRSISQKETFASERTPNPAKDAICRAALVSVFYDSLGYNIDTKQLEESGRVSVRLDMREGLGGAVIISDHDNADLNSLAIALDYMGKVAAGRPRTVILSDILFSSLPERELYGGVAKLIRLANIDCFIGIGTRISTHAELFAIDKRTNSALFYHTVAEFLEHFKTSDIAGHAVLVKGNPLAGFDKVLHRLERKSHTTVLEIDLDALLHNLDHFRRKVGAGSKIMAMVKASGYGNGGFEVAGALQNQGVDYLAVAFADEGIRLREQGITMPIVVLNADSDSFGLMVAGRLEPEIYNISSLEAFIAAVQQSGGAHYPIHVKIDSGMHRLGFGEDDIPALVDALRNDAGTVSVRSLFSHLAAADMPAEDDFTRSQIALFERLSGHVADAVGYMPLRHIANTSAIERFPQARFDMVRLGVGLYGVNPLGGTIPDDISGGGASADNKMLPCGAPADNKTNPAGNSASDSSSSVGSHLRPVGRLTTRIVQTRELAAGETVGYGRAGAIKRPTRVAVIPVGYADGLDRRLGEGRWAMEIAGRACPTVGRISMDNCVVDITGVEAMEGTPVMVFGGNGAFGIEEMARRLDTIPYEIMTSVSDRVRRIFIKN